MRAVRPIILFTTACILAVLTSDAQNIEVLNARQKKIHSIKQGKTLDFRIDYNKLYPDKKDEYLESRVYGVVDTIVGSKVHLSENYIVINYSKSESILVEKEYEYTDLVVDVGDIKAMSFTPVMASVGNAFLAVGLATMLVSPLLGFTPDGYSTDRVVMVASIGAGSAAIGGIFSLSFSQKPVKFKDFNGPEYFKKYQPGSLSVLEQ